MLEWDFVRGTEGNLPKPRNDFPAILLYSWGTDILSQESKDMASSW